MIGGRVLMKDGYFKVKYDICLLLVIILTLATCGLSHAYAYGILPNEAHAAEEPVYAM
jgi:hypothetical protein